MTQGQTMHDLNEFSSWSKGYQSIVTIANAESDTWQGSRWQNHCLVQDQALKEKVIVLPNLPCIVNLKGNMVPSVNC